MAMTRSLDGLCRVSTAKPSRSSALIGLVLLVCTATPAAAQTGETVEYYGLDAIGSVRVVFDPSGAVVGRLDFGPFGEELAGASPIPKERFAGLFRDGEAGLDYAEARMYQSRTGRLTKPDPVYASLFDPQRLNRYTYALNRPLSLVDPSGLDPVDPFCMDDPQACQPSPGDGRNPAPRDGPGDPCGPPRHIAALGVGDCGGEEPGGGGGQENPQTPTPQPTTTPPPPTPSSAPQPPGVDATINRSLKESLTWTNFRQCVGDQLGVADLAALGAVAAGQPIEGSKRFRTPGTSKGTSWAGKAANWLFGDAEFARRYPTIVGGPGTGRRLGISGTKYVARFAGRGVPVVGWAVLGYDAVGLALCTVGY
jgi:RHS repeat-associated protein